MRRVLDIKGEATHTVIGYILIPCDFLQFSLLPYLKKIARISSNIASKILLWYYAGSRIY
jgi:hypothetical protein